jgi:transposase
MSETRHHGLGSDGATRHWAIAMTRIQTAKLNGVEPKAWLTDVLERVVSGRTRIRDLHMLLPRNWQARTGAAEIASQCTRAA